jgi:hypothetical protein
MQRCFYVSINILFGSNSLCFSAFINFEGNNDDDVLCINIYIIL